MILRCLFLLGLPVILFVLFVGGFLAYFIPVEVETESAPVDAEPVQPFATADFFATTDARATASAAVSATPTVFSANTLSVPQMTATQIIRMATDQAGTFAPDQIATLAPNTPYAAQLTATSIIQNVTQTSEARFATTGPTPNTAQMTATAIIQNATAAAGGN